MIAEPRVTARRAALREGRGSRRKGDMAVAVLSGNVRRHLLQPDGKGRRELRRGRKDRHGMRP